MSEIRIFKGGCWSPAIARRAVGRVYFGAHRAPLQKQPEVRRYSGSVWVAEIRPGSARALACSLRRLAAMLLEGDKFAMTRAPWVRDPTGVAREARALPRFLPRANT